MIRLVASTIVERPLFLRSNCVATMEQLVKHHIRELPSMIRCFRNAIVSVSRWSKWGKLALLQHNIPVEIFNLVKPFLICRGAQDFYPNVSCDQWVSHRKYLLIEAKLYRLDLACKETLPEIRKYITDRAEFREESKNECWSLHQFNQRDKRIAFIYHVLMTRHVYKEKEKNKYDIEDFVGNIYEIDHLLQYWF